MTLNILKNKAKNVGIDKAKFKTIFDTWYHPIKNFVYYKSGDVEMAEDIVQETFFTLWEKRDSINTETVKSFLYTVANNKFINKHHHKKIVFDFQQTHTENNKPETPDFQLEMKEFDNKLQTALAGLSEKNRVVFLMNRIDDMTYKEIANSLNISIKAVEKRMKKALEHLRNCLKTQTI